ncbi:hypothetical protein NQZ68_019464 [Dissostichus eleginoides]|nr:hypothetical protein NQZ68_019464 [Dissostichus eleginoides]
MKVVSVRPLPLTAHTLTLSIKCASCSMVGLRVIQQFVISCSGGIYCSPSPPCSRKCGGDYGDVSLFWKSL